MNCNPFTLGHKYLIEYAASRVDRLIVFVVEENLSDFSFEERFELVKRGIADLGPKIVLLPSGTLISRKTFPGYWGIYDFISPEIDIENFANNIAPIFNITKRFAGTEPISETTREYNNFMRDILPQFGIEFVEVERDRRDGEAISASRVRKAFAENDFDTIRRLTPPATYEFLLARKKAN